MPFPTYYPLKNTGAGWVEKALDPCDRSLGLITKLLPPQANHSKSLVNENSVSIEITSLGNGMVVEPSSVGFDHQTVPAPEKIDLEGLITNPK